LSVLAPHLDGKVLVTRLDLEGLQLGAGSACASGSLEPSHVLLAMGLDDRAARAALRISMGRTTTWTELRRAVEILRKTLG
jgi:cysteine desulfurase